jgi:hypothetical protein
METPLPLDGNNDIAMKKIKLELFIMGFTRK